MFSCFWTALPLVAPPAGPPTSAEARLLFWLLLSRLRPKPTYFPDSHMYSSVATNRSQSSLRSSGGRKSTARPPESEDEEERLYPPPSRRSRKSRTRRQESLRSYYEEGKVSRSPWCACAVGRNEGGVLRARLSQQVSTTRRAPSVNSTRGRSGGQGGSSGGESSASEGNPEASADEAPTPKRPTSRTSTLRSISGAFVSSEDESDDEKDSQNGNGSRNNCSWRIWGGKPFPTPPAFAQRKLIPCPTVPQ